MLLRSLFLLAFIFGIGVPLFAQSDIDSLKPAPPVQPLNKDKDSVRAPVVDTIVSRPGDDSLSKKPVAGWEVLAGSPLGWQVLQHHPYFEFNTRAVSVRSERRVVQGKETMFYSIVALVFLFALLKLAFAKYFADLFRVFFRTTMKQRQIREQLMQTPLPSLLFNFFFVASAGLYLDFVLQYYNMRPVDNFWLLYLYCCIGLSVVYFVKFIGLKVCGWLFNMQQAADSYIFIVFIINKVIGIFLLPFVVLFGFTDQSDPVYSSALVLSWAGIGGLLLYRFILGYSAVRNEVRFNLFHFFLYLCAFEAAPLLLIYRVLLFFFN